MGKSGEAGSVFSGWLRFHLGFMFWATCLEDHHCFLRHLDVVDGEGQNLGLVGLGGSCEFKP